MAGVLRAGGRLVLDLYHPAFHAARTGDAWRQTGDIRFLEKRSMQGKRLNVELRYPSGSSDHFDWQLYSVDELIGLGNECGLELMSSCTDFDETSPPSPESSRMQVVFEKERRARFT
jgi:hypothetical protein